MNRTHAGADERLLRRPPAATFDPATLAPTTRAQARRWIAMGPGYLPGSPYQVDPATHWRPPSTTSASPGLLARLLDRVTGRTSGARAQSGKDRPGRSFEGAIWGLWCGLFAASPDEAMASSEALLATAGYATDPAGVDFRRFAHLLARTGPGPSSGTHPGAVDFQALLSPALPPLAVLSLALTPPGYAFAHLDQALRNLPWTQVAPDDAMASRPLERLAAVAPALDGLLAGYVFGALLHHVADARADQVGGEPVAIEPLWARLSAMTEDDFLGAENGRGALVNRRLVTAVLGRATPLASPVDGIGLVHAALWANLAATEFPEILRAVASLDGSPVALAAAGALAGARLGRRGIPPERFEHVPDHRPVAALVARFASD